MNSRFLSRSAAGVLLIAGLGYAASLAEDGPGGGHGRHFYGAGHMLGVHDLTAAQKQQIKQLRKAEGERNQQYWQQVAALTKQTRAEAMSGSFNEEKVRSLATQASRAKVELEVSRARLLAGIYNILTPEQRAEWASRQQKREQRMLDRKQRREQKQNQSNSNQ